MTFSKSQRKSEKWNALEKNSTEIKSREVNERSEKLKSKGLADDCSSRQFYW